jgi:hypothetical protein
MHIGVIHLCQRKLSRPLTPTRELEMLSLAELARMADQLETELFGRAILAIEQRTVP